MRDSIAGVESFVKTKTIAYGQSVKGSRLHAVYTKGRVSWNDDKLAGFALAHPEILEARKEGAAFASVREVKRD